jgi:AcrR family transcriptional regulator
MIIDKERRTMKENTNKEDLRIVKTKKALSEALFALLETTPFDAITVSTLCARAHVSRATFYNNFTTTRDVLLSSIQSFHQELENQAAIQRKEQGLPLSETYRLFISMIIDGLSPFIGHFSNMVKINGASAIFSMLENYLFDTIKHLITIYGEDVKTVPLDLLANYLAGAMAGLLIYLLPNHDKFSRQEIENYIYHLTYDVYLSSIAPKSLVN